MASAWGSSWGKSWGNSWGVLLRGGGHSTGNDYLRQKLFRKFEDRNHRLDELQKLPTIQPNERVAIKAAARKLATSPSGFDVADIEDQIKAALYPMGATPTALHVDWIMYFLRVEGYKSQQAQEDEETLEIAVALLMRRKMFA